MRGVGAALVAAGIVLAGCGVVEVDEAATTTTTVDPDSPVNPWSLPLEERPPLYDPCEELPLEAIHDALGPDVRRVDDISKHEEREINSCGWKDNEVLLVVTSTWRSSIEFQHLRSFEILEAKYRVGERYVIQLKDRVDATDGTCYHAFFTKEGTVVVNLNLTDSLGEFRGQLFSEGCPSLDQLMDSILPYIPEGDFL